MAKDLNRVTVTGNLGRDRIMSKTGDGTPVANITLANHKTRDNEKDPVWMKLAIWGKYASSLDEHLTKGRFAAIEGKLRGAECYLTQDGKDKLLKILQNAGSYGDNMKQMFIDMTNCFTAVPVVDVETLRFGSFDKKEGDKAESSQAPNADIQSQLKAMQETLAKLQGAAGAAEAEKSPV